MKNSPKTKNEFIRNCAELWYKKRDIKELMTLFRSTFGKNNPFFLLQVGSSVFKKYGYEIWVIFLSDLFNFNKRFRKVIQGRIDRTFFNLVTGWKGSGKKHIITSSKELDEKISFLVEKTSLQKPNFDRIYFFLTEQIKDRAILPEEWVRIKNTLIYIPESVETYYYLKTVMYKTLGCKNYKKINIQTNIGRFINYRKLRRRLFIFLLQNRDYKLQKYFLKLPLFLRNNEKEKVILAISILSYLFSKNYKNNDIITKYLLENAKIGAKKLKNQHFLCQIVRDLYIEEFYIYMKNKEFTEAVKILNYIEKKELTKGNKKSKNRINIFLVEGYLELTIQFLKLGIYGRAQRTYEMASNIFKNITKNKISNLKDLEQLFVSLNQQFQKIETEMIFILDTSFLCSVLDFVHQRKDEFEKIFEVINSYEQIDYKIPTYVWEEIPVRYKFWSPLLPNTTSFTDYEIPDERINDLKFLNEIRRKKFFTDDEIFDYKIIQTALDYKTDRITSIIVSNDEGIHSFVSKALQEPNVRSIWSHTFLLFLARNGKNEKIIKILEKVADGVEKLINEYRTKEKRKKLLIQPFDKTLISVKLEK
ncbi:MAG: hypothetical protein K9W46_12045 [Candidatus Heimdallarchaeum endolithica]|uniref:PIN domain-containing protein n=1 Tax=Candidatus Heimdallarchaeum endolithica TaxID=2876572 RepID=A0A9Y1FMV3_9ARCH|nr:MAG: hypothetical protein K9W46_12045 [Candidatus Heimdallarchaeum endolithica]